MSPISGEKPGNKRVGWVPTGVLAGLTSGERKGGITQLIVTALEPVSPDRPLF